MARLSRGISARSVSWKLLAPLLALTFILVIQLSGVPLAWGTAAKPDGSPVDTDEVEVEGGRLRQELRRLAFEARNPGTVSAGVSTPSTRYLMVRPLEVDSRCTSLAPALMAS